MKEEKFWNPYLAGIGLGLTCFWLLCWLAAALEHRAL